MTSEEISQAGQDTRSRRGYFNKTFVVVFLIASLLIGAGVYILVEKGFAERIVFGLSSSPADERALREAFELREILEEYIVTRNPVAALEKATTIVPLSRIVGLRVSKLDETTPGVVGFETLFAFSRSGSKTGERYSFKDYGHGEGYSVSCGATQPANFELRLETEIKLAPHDLEDLGLGPFGAAIKSTAQGDILLDFQGQVVLKPLDKGGDSLKLESEDGEFRFVVTLLLDEPR